MDVEAGFCVDRGREHADQNGTQVCSHLPSRCRTGLVPWRLPHRNTMSLTQTSSSYTGSLEKRKPQTLTSLATKVQLLLSWLLTKIAAKAQTVPQTVHYTPD